MCSLVSAGHTACETLVQRKRNGVASEQTHCKGDKRKARNCICNDQKPEQNRLFFPAELELSGKAAGAKRQPTERKALVDHEQQPNAEDEKDQTLEDSHWDTAGRLRGLTLEVSGVP